MDKRTLQRRTCGIVFERFGVDMKTEIEKLKNEHQDQLNTYNDKYSDYTDNYGQDNSDRLKSIGLMVNYHRGAVNVLSELEKLIKEEK